MISLILGGFMRGIVTLFSRSTLSAAMLVYAGGAIAASDMGEVVVTGSYIKGSAEDAASPITALISGPTTPLNPEYFNAADSATSGTPKFTDPLCISHGYSTGIYDEPANNPNSHCREDTRAYRGAQLAQERSVFMATMKHEFSDNVELYGMVQYNDQDIHRPINGAFGSIDDINGILPVGEPVFSLGSRSASVNAARGAAFGAYGRCANAGYSYL